MITVSYIMKRKIKKILIEVISNSKNFNIIFFNEIVNDQDFPKLTGGLDNFEYGIAVWPKQLKLNSDYVWLYMQSEYVYFSAMYAFAWLIHYSHLFNSYFYIKGSFTITLAFFKLSNIVVSISPDTV